MKLKAGLLFFLYLYLKVSLNGPMSFSFLNAGALFYKFFFSIFREPQVRLTSLQGWASHVCNQFWFSSISWKRFHCLIFNEVFVYSKKKIGCLPINKGKIQLHITNYIFHNQIFSSSLNSVSLAHILTLHLCQETLPTFSFLSFCSAFSFTSVI